MNTLTTERRGVIMNLENKTIVELLGMWDELLMDLKKFYNNGPDFAEHYSYECGKRSAIRCLVQSSGLYDDKVKDFIIFTMGHILEFNDGQK